MKDRKKKTLAIILLVIVVLLGGAGIYVAYLLQRAAVPTAPTSIPRAAEWLGGGNCNVSFNVVVTTTPTPASCNNTCSATVACVSGLSCVDGACRNASCTTETDCTCPEVTTTVTTRVTVTAAPTATATATGTMAPTEEVTAAPTAEQLPETGILNLPGAAAFGGGLLLTVLGILFAL